MRVISENFAGKVSKINFIPIRKSFCETCPVELSAFVELIVNQNNNNNNKILNREVCKIKASENEYWDCVPISDK